MAKNFSLSKLKLKLNHSHCFFEYNKSINKFSIPLLFLKTRFVVNYSDNIVQIIHPFFLIKKN